MWQGVWIQIFGTPIVDLSLTELVDGVDWKIYRNALVQPANVGDSSRFSRTISGIVEVQVIGTSTIVRDAMMVFQLPGQTTNIGG